MAYEHKDNTGSLFKNDRREKDTHPNLQGSAVIDGVEYWLSAWTNEGSKGKWISLKFKRKEGRRPDDGDPGFRDEDSGIPF